ncbi:hypothetical protein U1Q18_042990 [Sarracenia purpurea var. burkii]
MLQIRATFLLQIVSPFATDRRHHNLLVVKNALLHFVQFLLLVLCSSASKAAFPAGLGALGYCASDNFKAIHRVQPLCWFEGMGSSSFRCIGVADYLLLHFVCSSVYEQLGCCASVCLWRRGGRVCAAGLMCLGCASSLLVVCCIYAMCPMAACKCVQQAWGAGDFVRVAACGPLV